MRRCFVISPIGQEDSAVREHSDDVFDYIIQPAMQECGIEVLRSDHLHEPGKITDQMYREIFESDLCIAVLTGYNPNVFYELGIAQTASRPLIILMDKSQQLPFDLQDLRCVTYDLKPRSLFEKVYVKQIVDHIRNLEKMNWSVPSPFSKYVRSAVVSADPTAPRYYDRHQDYGGTEQWLGLIAATKERCDLMSLTLDNWKNRAGFRELAVRKAKEGCRMRLLLMHRDNAMLRDFADDTKRFDYLVPVIDLMLRYFEEIARESPNVAIRQIARGCPHSRLVITDQAALMIPYFYTSGHCMLLQAPKDSPLYKKACNEFDVLWNINGPPAPQA
jgi:hypothetical protein